MSMNHPPTTEAEGLRAQIEEILLHSGSSIAQPEHVDAIMQLHQLETAKAVQQAQTDAVAWAVGVIDEFHSIPHEDEKVDRDRFYKGVKNGLRDRYRSETGVDPAPNYPINVELQKGSE